MLHHHVHASPSQPRMRLDAEGPAKAGTAHVLPIVVVLLKNVCLCLLLPAVFLLHDAASRDQSCVGCLHRRTRLFETT